MEADDLARRIMLDISMVFKRQPNLDEFDIVPVSESQNKSPVIHLDTKMALEAWCVKLLYLHACSNLTQWRERRAKADDEKAVQWSELALLLNPEVLTFWNVRKELLCRGKILQSEDLRLCTLILTRKPKSPEVFSHRRWLLRRALSPASEASAEPPTSAEEMLKNELLLCTVAASRYPNNYSAWSHRQWVHDNLVIDRGEFADMMTHLLKDLKWSEEWVERHVSDHSGVQFRQYLLTKIANLINLRDNDDDNDGVDHFHRSTSIAQMFGFESDWTHRLVCDFPGHETLWYHCRYVTHSCHAYGILEASCSNAAVSGPTTCKKTKIDSISSCIPTTSTQRAPGPAENDFRLNLDDEIRFADTHMSIAAADDRLSQSDFATAYRRWLSHMFGPFSTSS